MSVPVQVATDEALEELGVNTRGQKALPHGGQFSHAIGVGLQFRCDALGDLDRLDLLQELDPLEPRPDHEIAKASRLASHEILILQVGIQKGGQSLVKLGLILLFLLGRAQNDLVEERHHFAEGLDGELLDRMGERIAQANLLLRMVGLVQVLGND